MVATGYGSGFRLAGHTQGSDDENPGSIQVMGLHEQLEVEAKFAVDNDTAVPDLSDIAGVARVANTRIHRLTATYFDTADVRLSRAKITLRRRTGGTDDGWHIKLPAANGRREIHHPLTTDAEQPPDVILAAVRAIIRNEELIPIAQVDNERHESLLADDTGAIIAEFCDDHVSAQSFLPQGEKTQWREWEIELTDACDEPDALLKASAEALRSAGAVASKSPSKLAMAIGDSIDYAPTPPQLAEVAEDSPAYAVLHALKRNRDKLVDFDPRVRRDEWDSVHQMRVATRELRSHLQTFEGILVGDTHLVLAEKLKQLAGILGQARDAEVIAERFRLLCELEETGAIDDATATYLHDVMRREYEHAHQRIEKVLDDARYLTMLDLLDEFLARPELAASAIGTGADRAASGKILIQHVKDNFRKLRNRHEKAVFAWEDSTIPLRDRETYFHDLRKAAKKLRYAAEAIGDATSIDTLDLYKACKDMQAVLGDFQDSVTARDKLLKLAGNAHRHGINTFGFGVLYRLEHELSQHVLADYEQTYAAVAAAFKQLIHRTNKHTNVKKNRGAKKRKKR
ncbi:hypothetical protein CMUST_11235 [Corynebacterium mustelae]|uniref:CHAD domain-containing protein n=1 Tax=Corynebacterium mustelae TaxID=571915 RepID=A0A0G3H5Y5_9CORY|nr:CYTH and CHAD domain-containing protein [Corynebacterium mustelae]AKK06562.1 hypothetical protein CMUST_11235 [Corynebacterium mustelae]